MIKAILFDLDGTLVDSAPSIALALNLLQASRGVARHVDVNAVRRLVSHGARYLVRHSLNDPGADPDRDLVEFRSIYAGIRTSPECVYPGAGEALRELKAGGIRLAVCTNKPQQLSEQVLQDTGIDMLFSAVIGGDAVLRCKPHPDHLFRTLAAIGVAANEAVYVGDSSMDAQAARGSKLPFWLAAYGYGDPGLAAELTAHPPAQLLDSLAALPALVVHHFGHVTASR